ncbi:MAG: sigma-54-dependent Fis family transcriptional regulator, partial [Acidobacteria bacterium]
MIPRPVLLVVDDEPVVGAVVKRLADSVGFDVVVCASAAEAIAGLPGRPIHMAFVDLRLPETNGLDLLRQIRDTIPACEVVLMSGFATIDSAVEAIKLGARDYLSKPLDFDRVTDLLKDVRDEVA